MGLNDALLPLPPAELREHYFANDNAAYLKSGKVDYDKMMAVVNLPDNARILEIGCCTGRVIRHFWPDAKAERYRVDGNDLEPVYVQWCRMNLSPMRFYMAHETPLGVYDFIFCHSVFTHVALPLPLLSLVQRALKPQGLFFVTIHDEVDIERIKELDQTLPLPHFIAQHTNLKTFSVPTMTVLAPQSGRHCKVFYKRDHFLKLAALNGLKFVTVVDKPHRGKQTGLLLQKTGRPAPIHL